MLAAGLEKGAMGIRWFYFYFIFWRLWWFFFSLLWGTETMIPQTSHQISRRAISWRRPRQH